jgi:hypothetical protein
LEYLISLAGQIEYFLGKTKEATCHVFNGLSFSLNGKLVEIKFQDNCFDKIVTESRYYRIPTLFEQLGINNSLMPKVEVPLINLFHQITRNMNFTDTICQIADLLDHKFYRGKIAPKKFNSEDAFIWGLDGISYFYENEWSPIQIFYKYLKDSDQKIRFSIFKDNEISERCFSFFPFDWKSLLPLLNICTLEDMMWSSAVILTDSFQLADINQCFLTSQGCRDIVWTAWDGNAKTIDHVDWNPLQSHRIYYLLKEHSGLSGKAVYEISLAVHKKLKKLNCEGKFNLKGFKYVSCLPNGISNIIPSSQRLFAPVVYSPDEIKERSNISSLSFVSFKNNLKTLASRRCQLMTPFIFERSATLINGKREAGKTWFTLIITYALSIGRTAFKGWHSGNKTAQVLYLHGEDYGFNSSGKKLADIVPCFTEKNSNNLYSRSFSINSHKNSEEQDSKNKFIPISDNFFLISVNKNPEGTSVARECSDNKDAYDARQMAGYIKEQANCASSYALVDVDGGLDAFPRRKLIVLDNLFTDNSEAMTVLNDLVRTLKRDGWAVIIVADKKDKNFQQNELHPNTKKNKGSQLNRLYTDTKITVRKVVAQEGILRIGINVASPFSGKSRFTCKIDFNKDPISFIREEKSSELWPKAMMDSDSLNKQIEFLHNTRHKGKEIAEKLGITHSLVKKRKGILGLSKKRRNDNQRFL